MNDYPEKEKSRVEQVPYPVWCCYPTGTFLWGTLLVIVGGALLLHQLNLIPMAWLAFLWPLVLLGFGVACLIWAVRSRRVTFNKSSD